MRAAILFLLRMPQAMTRRAARANGRHPCVGIYSRSSQAEQPITSSGADPAFRLAGKR
jgi:hypothetical protein